MDCYDAKWCPDGDCAVCDYAINQTTGRRFVWAKVRQFLVRVWRRDFSAGYVNLTPPTVKFPDAKFYSCTDPEVLTHEHPWDAVEEDLDADLDPEMTVEEVVASIRRQSLTVTAYNPQEISDKQIDHWAGDLLENLGEKFSDYQDPDDDPGGWFPKDASQIMREAVKSIIRRSRVWSCEPVGKVTLSPDEIEALAREHRPDWFVEARPEGGKGDDRG